MKYLGLFFTALAVVTATNVLRNTQDPKQRNRNDKPGTPADPNVLDFTAQRDGLASNPRFATVFGTNPSSTAIAPYTTTTRT